MLELDRLCDDERDVPLGDGGPPFVRAADAVYDSGQRQAARTVGRSSVVRIYPLRARGHSKRSTLRHTKRSGERHGVRAMGREWRRDQIDTTSDREDIDPKSEGKRVRGRGGGGGGGVVRGGRGGRRLGRTTHTRDQLRYT
jgi:hypothetical protein